MTTDEKQMRQQADAKRGDEGDWKRDPADIQVKSAASQVVSFRLSSDEFQALSIELERSGLKLPDFMREAIALRLASGKPDVTVMGRLTEWSKLQLTRSSTLNPVPDAPPLTVAM